MASAQNSRKSIKTTIYIKTTTFLSILRVRHLLFEQKYTQGDSVLVLYIRRDIRYTEKFEKSIVAHFCALPESQKMTDHSHVEKQNLIILHNKKLLKMQKLSVSNRIVYMTKIYQFIYIIIHTFPLPL